MELQIGEKSADRRHGPFRIGEFYLEEDRKNGIYAASGVVISGPLQYWEREPGVLSSNDAEKKRMWFANAEIPGIVNALIKYLDEQSLYGLRERIALANDSEDTTSTVRTPPTERSLVLRLSIGDWGIGELIQVDGSWNVYGLYRTYKTNEETGHVVWFGSVEDLNDGVNALLAFNTTQITNNEELRLIGVTHNVKE